MKKALFKAMDEVLALLLDILELSSVLGRSFFQTLRRK